MEQIAMYLRLSKKDEFIRDESNSITNQRAFIRNYINKDKTLRKMNALEFVDDGYTSKNMDRPDMQRMLDFLKRKQINCVIVKDCSRFSRDHIEQGKYIEQILPFMGVRFIAINDNYDSSDYVGGIGEIDVAFKGILYDFFSEEQSVKVSTTLDAKRGSGKYISAFAPYGYMKSPVDKHKLVVDEYAGQIVKRIFREYLSGRSMYKIAESLNEKSNHPAMLGRME
jgi:site-specific DNA recombinase